MTKNKEIEDLLASGREGTTQGVHSRELAAMMESLGCTDGAAKEAGYKDIFSYAEHVFSYFREDSGRIEAPRRKHRGIDFWAAIKRAMRSFSLSLAYPLPWLALLTLED